jgi:dihydrolipoamide dehydrogenase
MDRPHVVVVGAYGSAGVAAAEVLSEADVELTLVDDGDPGGGLCILRGCMPSKEVLSAAAHRYQPREDHRLHGVPEVDLAEVVATKNDHVLGFAEHRRAAVREMAERENVTFRHETAEFVDDCVLDIGGERVEPDYVVLATGSTLNVPDLPGVDEVEWMGSDDVLDATEFPDSGVVMGFGYVGLELVPYLSEAAGLDLTVVEHDARPMHDAHPSIGDELLSMYREEFDVEIRTEVYEESVEPTADGGVRVHLDDGTTAEGDQLFLFTGRVQSFPDGIEDTDLLPGPGWVDRTMQSNADDRIFVAGDAIGERMLLHTAKEEGYVAGRNVLRMERGERLERYDPMTHSVVFTGAGVYPYASLGMTAEEAREAGHTVVTAHREASDDGVFKTKDAPRGMARLVVDADDGTVLGYHGLHYHADVMAKTMQVVLEAEMDVRDVPDRAFHPTTPEILDGLFRDAKADL